MKINYKEKVNKNLLTFKMLTQEDIEDFFYTMSTELKKENIPILNNFIYKFKNYPTKEEINKLEEENNKEEENNTNYELIDENQ